MRFIDEAVISVKAGDGGNGIVSFRREKNLFPKADQMVAMVAKAVMFMPLLMTIPTP